MEGAQHFAIVEDGVSPHSLIAAVGSAAATPAEAGAAEAAAEAAAAAAAAEASSSGGGTHRPADLPRPGPCPPAAAA